MIVLRSVIMLVVCAAWAFSSPALANSPDGAVPLIGVGDKLKLTFYGREDISGEYSVQAEGAISIPLLGSFQAEGKTLAKLSEELQSAFVRDKNQPFQLIIEVTEWRPVYVTGLVDKPGQYAFMPGLTAMQAVAVAGGLFRPTAGGTFLGIARESTRIAEVRSQLARAQARKARLEAELSDDALPPSGGADSTTEAREGHNSPDTADQARILRWTQESMEAKLNSKVDEVSLSTQEISSYKRQLEEISEQIRLTRTLLAESQSLAERGLTPRMRIVEIQRIVAGLNAEREQINAQLARAERSKIQASQEAKTLGLDRKVQVQQELGGLEDRIATLQAELRTAQFVAATMPASADQFRLNEDTLTVRIVRPDRTESFTLAQAEKMLLKPGDLVMVEMKQTADAEATSSKPAGADLAGHREGK